MLMATIQYGCLDTDALVVSLAFDKTQLFKEMVLVFKTGFCYIVQTGLEFTILLLQPSGSKIVGVFLYPV